MFYMLNLIFDYTDTNTAPNGRFVDYDPTQTNPYLTSKAWLQSSDGQNWIFFARDHQHLDFDLSLSPILSVRVVDRNQSIDNYAARITIIMGRNDQKSAQQEMSSPIHDTNSITGPLCTWDTGGFITTDSTLGDTPCWVAVLGQANLGSDSGTDNYLFLVGAYVQGNPYRTFSHDPDMDINC